MGKFTRMPKMMTTEPSVDEVKMKKGGKAKKMAMGGDPRMAAMPAQQDPRMMAEMKKRAMMARQPAAAAQPPMMMRKKGGKADMSQDKALIKKAFKQHDMQEHKGDKGTSLKLKKGGMHMKNGGSLRAPRDAGRDVPGGLLGGISATKTDPKMTTGGVRNGNGGGSKKGGMIAKKGDAFQTRTTLKPKIDVMDKVVSAKQTKSVNTSTGGVKNGKPAGYKMGGTVPNSVAKRYVNDDIQTARNPKQLPKKTGDIKQRPAGYKDGGHVAMACKADGGFTTMKKMAKC